ncbi:putative secreted protein (Por secretion system target) [Algoriphagus ratkowskyi]|uniref:Putative secreted protein (Por secretion system target) n=1 Tax=Algoriphagus ratkowskyi TaxID=57028 RepID=A0A2W7S013_9BACT|nr:FG-GAP-like repeat-containing protein [Algoriphagus ratkowskyi]PZX60189.1 putative secreted protein (Por secretion system target) [Algoriphagus ratkowskyi]TXD78014.1 hypothetical protein ESW18_08165 [Algoriphagus ratkowskyi]
MRKFWIFIFLISSFQLSAQEIFRIDQQPQVEINKAFLSAPFTGGINAAQIGTIDLTGDGIEEWVTWDINSRQLLVLKKDGEKFIHLPELSYSFPADISGFLVLVDFDGDGKKDLFTSTALGIKAYKNTSSGNQISWQIAQNFLKIDGSGNIQTNNLDTPLLQDLDGDGDLDLVIFNFAGGDYMEFYKNTSVERKGSADIDGFAFAKNHWGNFEFCGCGDIAFGKTCTGTPLAKLEVEAENMKLQHSGGHSILYQDFDGDGIEDLLLGRDECSILYFLPNSGTSAEPVFDSFSNTLPAYGDLPTFPIFHIGQLIDESLIISLNSNETSFNYKIDFANSIVRIDAQGNTDYEFLQNQMIDLGENSRPFFSGNKSQGELSVTSNTLMEGGQVKSILTKFELLDGKLTKKNNVQIDLSALELVDAQYIRYRDKSGRAHELISGIKYTNNFPSQILFQLAGTVFSPVSFTGYTPMRGDYFQFFNYESKDMMLVASQNGSLDLYTVDFSNFTASLVKADFLEFIDNPANRNLSIAVLQKSNPDLYTIDQNGILSKINDFMKSSTRTEVLVQIGNQNLPTRLGRNTWIAPISPAFDSAIDLILGTRGGGLIYLSSTEDPNPDTGDYKVKIYPNPSDGPIKVFSNKASTGTLINSLGQELLSKIQIPANTEVEIQASFLAPALYILILESEGKFRESRKIWIR